MVLISISLLLLILHVQVFTFGLGKKEKSHDQIVNGKSKIKLKDYQVVPARFAEPTPLQLIAPPTNQALPSAFDQDEMGNDLVDLMSKISANLEGITNYGSDVSDILDAAARVIRLLPEVDNARNTVLSTMFTPNGNQLNNDNQFAAEASERLAQSMNEILNNPLDANVIRQEYPHIRESFRIIEGAFGEIAATANPQAAVGKALAAGFSPIQPDPSSAIGILRSKGLSTSKGLLTSKSSKENFAQSKSKKLKDKAGQLKTEGARLKNGLSQETAQRKHIDLKEKAERLISEEGKPKNSGSKDSFNQRKNLSSKAKETQPISEEGRKNDKKLAQAPKQFGENSSVDSQVRQHPEAPNMKDRLRKLGVTKPTPKPVSTV